MVDINKGKNTISISVSSGGSKGNAGIGTPQSFYDGLARDWAISDKLVQGIDYSSKYYAGVAQANANSAAADLESVQGVVLEVNQARDSAIAAVEQEGEAQIEGIKAQAASYATKEEAKYIAGAGIDITDNVVTNTRVSAEWGNIEGDIEDQGDLIEYVKTHSACFKPGFLYTPCGLIDESENIFRYANGQICQANDSIKGLLSFLGKQKDLGAKIFCTEEEWQASKLLSPFGQVSKFVLNYENTPEAYPTANYLRTVYRVPVYSESGLQLDEKYYVFHKALADMEVGDEGYRFNDITGVEDEQDKIYIAEFLTDFGGNKVRPYKYTTTPGGGEESGIKDAFVIEADAAQPIKEIIYNYPLVPASGQSPCYIIPKEAVWEVGATCYEVAYPTLGDDTVIKKCTVTGYSFTPATLLDDSVTKLAVDGGEEIVVEKYATSQAYYYTPSIEELMSVRLPAVYNVKGEYDVNLVGGLVEQSLPNIKGTFNTGDRRTRASGTEAFYATTTTNSGTYSGQVAATTNEAFGFDASRCSSAYQDGAPVQEEACLYPYVICVNSAVEEAERPINNYTVANPYSYGDSKYYRGALNNTCFLKGVGQWNSGAAHNGCYQWVLEQVNNGVDGFKMATAEDITDYDFVINTEDETFRLPLLNGEEHLPDWDNAEPREANTPYTAECNGYIYGYLITGNDNSYTNIQVNNAIIGAPTVVNAYADDNNPFCIFVKRGDRYKLYTTGGKGPIYFAPAIGNGNLYYYIGDVEQNVDLVNIARMQEELVDIKSELMEAKRSHLIKSYQNGLSGYRIYSDGYCEQWGRQSGGVVTFIQPFRDENHVTIATKISSGADYAYINVYNFAATGFKTIGAYVNGSGTGYTYNWRSVGYVDLSNIVI